jgi:hypothetical protein
MRKISPLAVLVLAVAGAAPAVAEEEAPNCGNAPRAQWLSEDAIRARGLALRYDVGAMVIALLAILSATCATGVMMTTDAFWGVEWVEEAHQAAVNLMLVLIALHLAGVFARLR